MAELEYFTVISNRLGAVGIDFVDLGLEPDEDIVYAFVEFVPREEPGTTHWLAGLTNPRGIQLDRVKGRYSPEDGKLRTIVGDPTNEEQTVTVTGTPFTLTYAGQTTTSIASSADPGAVQAALEALSNIAPGDIYVYRTVTNEKQTISFSGAPTGGQFTLTYAGETTAAIGRNSNAGYIQQRLQALSTIGSEGCSVTGPVGGPWIVEFTGLLSGINVASMTANSAGLTPAGTVVITQTTAGSSTAPYHVAFIGTLQGTNVAQMTATNATVATLTSGASEAGVMLVANTDVMEIEGDLIYDVYFTVPERPDRKINPFGIIAPTTGGGTVDLADADLHVPPKAL